MNGAASLAVIGAVKRRWAGFFECARRYRKAPVYKAFYRFTCGATVLVNRRSICFSINS
jgi:hypothetical protein